MLQKLIEKRFYNVKELSNYTGLKVQSIYNLCYRKEIPFHKVGGGKNSKTLFDIQEIESWIKSNKGAANG
jgi:excisionase family DNA binding protein